MRKQSTKGIEELPKRLLRFAEMMALGNIAAAQAARECGFKNSTALAHAYQWIGKTRETSQYPALYDYYEQLVTQHLRLYDVTADNLVKELRIIAFSSISSFLDLPSKKVHDKIEHLSNKIDGWLEEMQKYWVPPVTNAAGKIMQDGFYDGPQAKVLSERIRKARGVIKKLELGPGYKLRLKYVEDIPAALMPAVAEISETKEGIRVKLHSKLDGIDKLAKWLKMYDENKEAGGAGEANEITQISFTIKGSRSEKADMIISAGGPNADTKALPGSAA